MKTTLKIILSALLFITTTSCGGNVAKTTTTGEYIYGQIDSISGNDMVLLMVDYDENATESSDSADENKKKPEGFDPSAFSGGDGEKEFTRPENGEMPEGFDPSSFGGGDGEKEFTRPENGEMPEGFDKSNFSGKRPGSSKSSKYNLTGDQEEFLIPVGTVVTTDSGTETDFSVLEKGNIIKCDISKDSDGNSVINAIWVVE